MWILIHIPQAPEYGSESTFHNTAQNNCPAPQHYSSCTRRTCLVNKREISVFSTVPPNMYIKKTPAFGKSKIDWCRLEVEKPHEIIYLKNSPILLFSRPFPEGIFYEFEGRKYCEHDFHVLFAPCCNKCGEFIIGRVIKVLILLKLVIYVFISYSITKT